MGHFEFIMSDKTKLITGTKQHTLFEEGFVDLFLSQSVFQKTFQFVRISPDISLYTWSDLSPWLKSRTVVP